MRAIKGHGLDPASFSFKAGDALYAAFQCRTPDTLIAWGSKGRVYSVPVQLLPGGRGDGVPVTSLIELEAGTQLLHYFAAGDEQQLVLASSNGFGFVAKLGDMISRVKAGKSFMSIDADARPLAPMPVPAHPVSIACLSSGGRLLVFPLDEMKTLSAGGRGVTLMALDDGETLVRALAIDGGGLVLEGTARVGKPGEDVFSGAALEAHLGKRARRGRVPDSKLKAPFNLRPKV